VLSPSLINPRIFTFINNTVRANLSPWQFRFRPVVGLYFPVWLAAAQSPLLATMMTDASLAASGAQTCLRTRSVATTSHPSSRRHLVGSFRLLLVLAATQFVFIDYLRRVRDDDRSRKAAVLTTSSNGYRNSKLRRFGDRSLNRTRTNRVRIKSQDATDSAAAATHVRVAASGLATGSSDLVISKTLRSFQEGSDPIVKIQKPRPPEGNNTVNVLFCMSGDHPGFIDEFEVAFKSVILNAPLDADLWVHVIADHRAYVALEGVLQRSDIASLYTRNQVLVSAYNIQSRVSEFRNIRDEYLRSAKVGMGRWVDEEAERHTVGAWFRLFADKVLPDTVENVIYLDTDAAVFANLQQLWRLLDTEPAFYLGPARCSGFMVLNVKKIPLIWSLAASIDMVVYKRQNKFLLGDQLVIRAAGVAYPPLEGTLPLEWDVSMIGEKTLRYVADRYDVLGERPQVGMLHFNGGAKSKESYFREHSHLFNNSALDDTLGLVKNFVHMPWSWVRYHALTRARDGQGKQLWLNYTAVLPPKVSPGPVFVMSFHKSGITGTHRYFECGLGRNSSVHGRIEQGPRAGTLVAECMAENNASGRPLVEGCGNYRVFSGAGSAWIDPYSSEPKCFYPGLHGLQNIATHYPDATIVLLKRNTTEWIESIHRWGGVLNRLSAMCDGFPQEGSTERETRDSWADFYEMYVESVRNFARDHPSLTYVESQLESHETANVLEEASGIPGSCWEVPQT